MTKESSFCEVDEASKAYEASNFLHAENLSRHVLQQGCNEAHCCPKFTIALFLLYTSYFLAFPPRFTPETLMSPNKAAKSHAQIMHNEQILSDLVAAEPQQTTCILSHNFPEDLNTFHGTEDDFNAMRHKSISAAVSTRKISVDNLSIRAVFVQSLFRLRTHQPR
ncbi:hypothetical protein FGIG_09495 [Fasciola gigantica]|uniref:Uncharacterized protein n=1 Tax=Fasciola gigantica TaxID=46835 RepID=A0A504Z8I9_FASGI|nr:hypothetical protein FGIG_09495 [Fasciola gigantica]